jgi:uncharacterized protein YdiU (UPF0061 family)
MNTDNMTISGETIDYGPCAFMEQYDPLTVFSSIDHGGRYAYGRQPALAQWDLARLAEALLPLMGADHEAAGRELMAVLETFPERFDERWRAGMQAKLGVGEDLDQQLVNDLLQLLHDHGVDWTTAYRALADEARGNTGAFSVLTAGDPAATTAWLTRWRALQPDPEAMDRVNPAVIPRNAAVEDALAFATTGDLRPYEELLAAVRTPFTPNAKYATPDDGDYVTYCGT